MATSGKDLVFIVGPARSGTKLLQGILNQSDRVSIGPESHIFPKLLRDFGGQPPVQNADRLRKIFLRSNYFLKLKRNGFRPDLERHIERSETIEELVHSVIKEVGLWQNPKAELFGDKTPTYAQFIDLFRERFPRARFVGILRDPRDRSLSVASSWGKSALLSAQEWKKPARSILSAKKQHENEFLLLHYERLLEEPKATLEELCSYLEIPYASSMLEAESKEKRGAGQGRKGIMVQNTGKFKEKMKAREIRRIEELLYNDLQEAGYPIQYATSERRFSLFTLFFLRVSDLLKNIRFHVKERGLVLGLRYMISLRMDKLK